MKLFLLMLLLPLLSFGMKGGRRGPGGRNHGAGNGRVQASSGQYVPQGRSNYGSTSSTHQSESKELLEDVRSGKVSVQTEETYLFHPTPSPSEQVKRKFCFLFCGLCCYGK